MKKLCVIWLVALAFNLYSQNYGPEYRKFFVMDILSSGLVAGVGSMVKVPTIKSFASGFLKGAIGGSICFSSKYMAHEIKKKESLFLGWPIKILNSAGASFTDNGIHGRGMFDNFAIDYGPFRLDISTKTRLRLQPFAALGIVQHISNGHRFDLGRSLILGVPCFTQSTVSLSTGIQLGNTYVNSVSSWNRKDYGTYAHEFIHALQARAQLSFNNLYLKNDRRIYLDIPISDITYSIEMLRTNYSGNIYERQARILSERY